MSEEQKKKQIIITKKDLPFFCPTKQTWDGHPKIYLDTSKDKNIICPYCGTIYKVIQS